MQKGFLVRGAAVDILVDGKTTSPMLHFEISSRRFPKAVTRNKIKRWCREALRKTGFPRKNIAITVRVKSGTPDFNSILKDFARAEVQKIV